MYVRFFKRILDIIISILFLPFFLVVLIFVAIAIKIEDRGPVFYCANRLGKNGKIFKMIKFRSMKVNSPNIIRDGQTYNSNNDPRVTKVGKFLRNSSIDEIPQILNVLFGDMSFIGPRAHLVTSNFVGYENLTPERKKRLEVKPGLTGYSQAYYRNSISASKKIKEDCFYVDNISFALDIKIFIKTIETVLFRRNININDKKIIVLGASLLQVPLISECKNLGYYVIVVDYNPNAIGIKYADEYINCSTNDEQKIVEIAKNIKPDCIITAATDMPMRSIARVNEALGLTGISYETAILCTNKHKMIEILNKNKIDTPWYFFVDNITQLQNIKEKLIYPCIMKPIDSSGSRGVTLNNSYEELIKNFSYSNSYSKNGGVLVEEYLVGDEISVEVLIQKSRVYIIAITDKITTGAPHFVELGHSQPSSLPKKKLKDVKKIVRRTIRAVGIENGAAHIEIIITPNGPKIIEIGARLGGDYITSDLVPLSTGVNMLESVIKISLGEKIRPKIRKVNGSAIRFIKTNKGKIKKITGLKNAINYPGICNVQILKQIGEEIKEFESSLDRVGYVIARGRNADDAIQACLNAIELIKIDVE